MVKRKVFVAIAVMVAALIALLAAHVIGSSRTICLRSDRARSELYAISDALEQYRESHGRYPTTSEGLFPLVDAELLRKIPEDPWFHAYEYRCPGTRSKAGFDLWTYGADGRPGGNDIDKDIGNWDDDD